MKQALRLLSTAKECRVRRSADIRFGNEIAIRTANALEWRGFAEKWHTGRDHPTITITALGEKWLRENEDEVQCSACDGLCKFSEGFFVCQECGAEWSEDHDPKLYAGAWG